MIPDAHSFGYLMQTIYEACMERVLDRLTQSNAENQRSLTTWLNFFQKQMFGVGTVNQSWVEQCYDSGYCVSDALINSLTILLAMLCGLLLFLVLQHCCTKILSSAHCTFRIRTLQLLPIKLVSCRPFQAPYRIVFTYASWEPENSSCVWPTWLFPCNIMNNSYNKA